MTNDTDTATLSGFLLARIAEDETQARAATPGPWRSWIEGRDGLAGDDVILTQDTSIDLYLGHGTGVPPQERNATQDHIARHDPARVLAECEAKLRIVDMHRLVVFEEAKRRGSGGCLCRGGWPCPTLRALALPYADHPDFREEWALS